MNTLKDKDLNKKNIVLGISFTVSIIYLPIMMYILLDKTLSKSQAAIIIGGYVFSILVLNIPVLLSKTTSINYDDKNLYLKKRTLNFASIESITYRAKVVFVGYRRRDTIETFITSMGQKIPISLPKDPVSPEAQSFFKAIQSINPSFHVIAINQKNEKSIIF